MESGPAYFAGTPPERPAVNAIHLSLQYAWIPYILVFVLGFVVGKKF